MSIVAQSPSHRGEIAVLFIRDAATLYAILIRSVRSRYDLATIYVLLFRHSNLGASATFRLRSWRSGQLQAWFKCSPKVGVALFDPRTNSDSSN